MNSSGQACPQGASGHKGSGIRAYRSLVWVLWFEEAIRDVKRLRVS